MDFSKLVMSSEMASVSQKFFRFCQQRKFFFLPRKMTYQPSIELMERANSRKSLLACSGVSTISFPSYRLWYMVSSALVGLFFVGCIDEKICCAPKVTATDIGNRVDAGLSPVCLGVIVNDKINWITPMSSCNLKIGKKAL